MGGMSVWHWLIFLTVVYIMFRLIILIFRLGARGKDDGGRRGASGGEYATEIVGESHYQKALESLAGGRFEDAAEKHVSAVLIHEDDNAHDSNAVRVDIRGKTVGYLSREDARTWRAKAPGSFRHECPAVIVGGWDRGDGDRGHFGVRLDLTL